MRHSRGSWSVRSTHSSSTYTRNRSSRGIGGRPRSARRRRGPRGRHRPGRTGRSPTSAGASRRRPPRGARKRSRSRSAAGRRHAGPVGTGQRDGAVPAALHLLPRAPHRAQPSAAEPATVGLVDRTTRPSIPCATSSRRSGRLSCSSRRANHRDHPPEWPCDRAPLRPHLQPPAGRALAEVAHLWREVCRREVGTVQVAHRGHQPGVVVAHRPGAPPPARPTRPRSGSPYDPTSHGCCSSSTQRPVARTHA